MYSLFHYHPRFVIVLAVGILICLLLAASDPLQSLGCPLRLEDLIAKGRTPLEAKLEDAERDYQAVVARRAELIKKHGGKVKNMAPFPTGGQLYTLWDFWLPAFTCPHKIERIGALGDGGKYVCGLERIVKKKGCAVYSIGINGESSFEASILKRVPGCHVFGYDISSNSFGPEITDVRSLRQRSHFWAWGLSGQHSHRPNDTALWFTLDTLMRMNGHEFIDILKIDIEGAEFDVLADLIHHYSSLSPPQPLPFGQLQLEIHAQDAWGRDLSKLLKWWEKLEETGLRPFWTEPSLVYMNIYRGGQAPDLAEYSFINTRGVHELISDAAFLAHEN